MKAFCLLALAFIGFQNLSAQEKQSFYELKSTTIDGTQYLFSSLKGKKVLIVNTASKCGYTPQYKQLEDIYKKYGGESFTIIGFPANNFMNQEPGSNKDIVEFCQLNYGVSFQMMEKISVKGKNIDPVYKWLTSKELNGVMESSVKWNFQKYLINSDGTLFGVAEPSEKPDSERIISWITGEQKK
jgi:glutathione peroxidase